MNLTKSQWVELAEAYIVDYEYDTKMISAMDELATKYDRPCELPDIPYRATDKFILKLLGFEFEYWCFECDRNYNKFNRNTTYADGSHPSCYNLEDLYDETIRDEEKANGK